MIHIEILKGDGNIALHLKDTSAYAAWEASRLISKSCGYTVQLTDDETTWKVLFHKGKEIT